MGSLLLKLTKFDAIPKRIAEFKSSHARELDTVLRINADCLKAGSPSFQILDLIRDMRFCNPTVDVILGADVKLSISNLEPESSASRELIRFRDLFQPENAAVKFSGFIFSTFRDGYLSVVDCEDHYFWRLSF